MKISAGELVNLHYWACRYSIRPYDVWNPSSSPSLAVARAEAGADRRPVRRNRRDAGADRRGRDPGPGGGAGLRRRRGALVEEPEDRGDASPALRAEEVAARVRSVSRRDRRAARRPSSALGTRSADTGRRSRPARIPSRAQPSRRRPGDDPALPPPATRAVD